MTKPALISQTNKRDTVTPLNRRVGRIRIIRPRQVQQKGEGRRTNEILRASAGCYRHTVGSLRKERMTVGWLRRDNAWGDTDTAPRQRWVSCAAAELRRATLEQFTPKSWRRPIERFCRLADSIRTRSSWRMQWHREVNGKILQIWLSIKSLSLLICELIYYRFLYNCFYFLNNNKK